LKVIKLVFILLLIIVIFYFSWLKNPNFDHISVIPIWLNTWSNLHGRLRTAVPFIPLGFILNTYRTKWKLSISGILICFMLVVIAELGQYFIPTRYLDIFDVLSGIFGSLLGMLIHLIINSRETKI
jgi:glycopeptide antibiotics resistance protein